MRRHPTILDVASHAGVSKSTVSNVVRGLPGVSEATRRRVGTAIRELGYRPNVLARQLVQQRTSILGVVVGDLVEGLAGGDDDQQPPQVVAVVELGEPAAGHPLEEAVEGILDDVLLVGGPAAGGPELVAGQADEPAVVPLPERLGGGRVPALQGRDPTRD